MSEPKPDGKPFVISRRLVWEAWRRVKANHGVAGVDEESIQAFEESLGTTSTWSGIGCPRGVTCRRRSGQLRIPKKGSGLPVATQ